MPSMHIYLRHEWLLIFLFLLLQLPFIAMYRKELCPSLLKDSEDLSEGGEGTTRIRWHKVCWLSPFFINIKIIAGVQLNYL